MIPIWFRPWMAWAAALLVLVGLLGLQTVRLAEEQRDHATTVSMWAKNRESLERAALQAAEDARTEEQRRTKAAQEIANETQAKLDQARNDADTARTAGERLRKRVAELTASIGRGGAGNPTSGGASASAQKTADLLADVQRRLDEATDGIAGFADGASAAGSACERSYDALTSSGLKR